MPTISAVIITFNEERNIRRCLDSLLGIADEIVVVDSFSTDTTPQICHEYGVVFKQQKWLGYGHQKNTGNSLASKDYILSLDADEALSNELRQSILEIKKSLQGEYYVMNRITNYCGKWIRHCGWYPDSKMRLWKKNTMEWSLDIVHEEPILYNNSPMHKLKGDILHYSYHSIKQHIDQFNSFTELGAKVAFDKGKKTSIFGIILKTHFTFFKSYILQLGILDGYYGFVICFISSFATFAKYTKLKELWKQSKES